MTAGQFIQAFEKSQKSGQPIAIRDFGRQATAIAYLQNEEERAAKEIKDRKVAAFANYNKDKLFLPSNCEL